MSGSAYSRWIPAAGPPLILALGTIAICWRLVASPFQFAINDLAPFGSQMLRSCASNYATAGLGRENPHTSPSLCDYGALSVVLGGANAQHFFLIGCFILAGVSMYFLLRRIGNAFGISFLGAVVYELSPIMLSFQLSGEGLVVTAALLPAVLFGAIAARGTSPYIEGARSGALLALVCYANAQAPAFVVFLLFPLIAVRLLWPSPGNTRNTLIFSVTSAVVFLLAVVPVLQILPGFGATLQASQAMLQSDLLARLDWNALKDFFTPYGIVGIIPALIGFLVLPYFQDVRPSEWAAAVSIALILFLWETLKVVGPTVATVFPLITMYKDFIKLEILLAVPFTILSATALRWALTLQRSSHRRLRYGLVFAIAALFLLPVFAGEQHVPLYTTRPTSVPNSQALLSGQLGLPSWAGVPLSYTDVLGALRRQDPNTESYRVLWLPIDWRLMQNSRAADTNLLVYWADGSPQSRQAIRRAFDAIANDRQEQIASLLADMGVKYVVVDLADGQDRNAEPWQKGPPTDLAVWGTQALVGVPRDYKQILSKSQGLKVIEDAGKWVIYRNLNWRPILQSYSALLTVDGSLSNHPEDLLSLWHELPGLLIETGDRSLPAELRGVESLSLSQGQSGSGQIRLLTATDLGVTGRWTISRLADPLGIEKFTNDGGGLITVGPALLKAAPAGSTITWIEYKSGETEPSTGGVHSVAASPGGVTIGCSSANCTIANVLIVPVIPRDGQLTRLAYAYSPLLRTPSSHRSPVSLPSDWASLYSPPPTGYPSALYDSSTLARSVGLIFGHLVALAALVWAILAGRRSRSAFDTAP